MGHDYTKRDKMFSEFAANLMLSQQVNQDDVKKEVNQIALSYFDRIFSADKDLFDIPDVIFDDEETNEIKVQTNGIVDTVKVDTKLLIEAAEVVNAAEDMLDEELFIDGNEHCCKSLAGSDSICVPLALTWFKIVASTGNIRTALKIASALNNVCKIDCRSCQELQECVNNIKVLLKSDEKMLMEYLSHLSQSAGYKLHTLTV